MARNKSHQEGSVRLRGNVWTLRYREFDHDRRKWISKREKLGRFKNRKDALRAAQPIMAQVNERNNSPAPRKRQADIRFREFIDGRWKSYTETAKHQPSTKDSHNSLIKNHLLPAFSEKMMREISPGDISEFFDKKRSKVSAHTMHRFYGLLHLMFDIALQYDLVEQSPVRSKLHKPQMKQVEKPTLSALEIRNVLASLPDEQERLFALFLAVTGLRMGEVLALCWQDFNASASEVVIAHTLYRGRLKQPKTEGSQRPLRLAPSIAELIVSHREQSKFQAETDFLFCRPDGKPLNPTALRTHLYKAMDAAKIERAKGQYGFHIFRHSAGSLLYARSRDLKLVQSTLGHANISTTSDIYVHLADKVISEGTEILTEEILGNRVQTAPKKRRKAG